MHRSRPGLVAIGHPGADPSVAIGHDGDEMAIGPCVKERAKPPPHLPGRTPTLGGNAAAGHASRPKSLARSRSRFGDGRHAEPGDTVEIRIRAIDLWLPIAAINIAANRGTPPEEFPYTRHRVVRLDLEKKTVDFAPGVVIPAKPFWGVIGVAPPPGMGRVPSGPPNIFGGNMDNHDLLPGTSLYLPVHASGALISIGDGHAAQGSGEVTVSAIETSLKGEIQVVLHKGMRITWPRAETPTPYMTMGLHEDLNQATEIATREMLNFIVETEGMPRDDVYMLLSAAMDLNVTQIVDGTKGINAMLPKAIFQK
jgi:acetamidase/formamidase